MGRQPWPSLAVEGFARSLKGIKTDRWKPQQDRLTHPRSLAQRGTILQARPGQISNECTEPATTCVPAITGSMTTPQQHSCNTAATQLQHISNTAPTQQRLSSNIVVTQLQPSRYTATTQQQLRYNTATTLQQHNRNPAATQQQLSSDTAATQQQHSSYTEAT
ncbi:hypothetical protein ACLKA6_016459 [Drosophila palustris]